MKAIPPRNWVAARVAFIVLVAVLLAATFGVRHKQALTQQQENRRIAADWQKNGHRTLRRIIDETLASGTISDRELDWSLAAMKGSPDAVVHAQVLGLLEIVVRSSQVPVFQKHKIAAAIVPFLGSQIRLDRLASVRVQRVLHGQSALPFRPRS